MSRTTSSGEGAMARLRKRSAFISKFISFMKSKGSTGETLDSDKGRAEEASALQVKEYRDASTNTEPDQREFLLREHFITGGTYEFHGPVVITGCVISGGYFVDERCGMCSSYKKIRTVADCALKNFACLPLPRCLALIFLPFISMHFLKIFQNFMKIPEPS
ncbi:hypothetical protein CVT26_015240 [Gymnopilus dilepis]|uniref:Uncharacterized protein n=1 Tax=Gymnopilus dilepis TaxID=231916 RepID=A0A409W438_9AGAR|nr:hypothetical protein CVT26_015240 [Gymnopilus dilepis]